MRLLIGSTHHNPVFTTICLFVVGMATITAVGWKLQSDQVNISLNENVRQDINNRSLSFISNSSLKKYSRNLGDEGSYKTGFHQSPDKSVSNFLKNEDFRADVHLPDKSEIEKTDIHHNADQTHELRTKLKPGFSGNMLHLPLLRTNRSSCFVSIKQTLQTDKTAPSSNKTPGELRIIDSVTGRAIMSASYPAEHYRFSVARHLRYGAGLDRNARRRDAICLSKLIYFEARGEVRDGQLAVAQIVMNRVRSSNYPDTVCGVVFEGKHLHNRCQFSFACDGKPDVISDTQSWSNAQSLAKSIIDGQVWLEEIGAANHYHAEIVVRAWSRSMRQIAKIGSHTFYLRPQRKTAQVK